MARTSGMDSNIGLETVSDNLADFGNEFAKSAVATPWNGLAQITERVSGLSLPQVNSQGAENPDSLGAKAGALCGFVLDFALLALATKSLCKPLVAVTGVAETGALASAARMGLAGAVYGGIFTPTEAGGTTDLISSRLEQAAVQAGTFTAMSLSASALGGGFRGTLAQRIETNAIGGAIGGGTNALLSAGLIDHRLASGAEVVERAGTFATFGAAFAGLDFALGKGISTVRQARGGEIYPPEITEKITPFKRLSVEPILGPREGKFDSAGAFNPTATRLPNGDVAILYRAQNAQGISTVGYARTGPDGIKVLERSDEPVLAPRVANERLGIEDPRMTADASDPSQWDLTATKYDGKDAQLSDWTSRDLKNWEERGIMMPAGKGTWNTGWTKSGSIVSQEVDGKFVPAKINGKFWMFYMGTRAGLDELGLSSSVDGIKWTDATREPVLPRRPGLFDSNLVEPGPTAIVTKDGINLIYNGGMPYKVGDVVHPDYKYQAGLAVFSKDDPTKLLYRSSKPIFSPETTWEKENSSTTVRQVPNVVFAQGIIPDGKGGYLVYYGAADSYVGVAQTRFVPLARTLLLSGLVDATRQAAVRSPAALNFDQDQDKRH